jgi:arylsulfatase A-like enzyme
MKQRPNILLITADAMRFDALNCNGNALAVSPNIDGFAQSGTRFNRAYCSQPICMPCRASIMSGRFPSAHGVWQNGIPFVPDTPTLSSMFNGAGYFTGIYGKAHFLPWADSMELGKIHIGTEHADRTPYYGFQDALICDHSKEDAYCRWVQEKFPQHAQLALSPFNDRPEGAVIAWKSTLPREASRSQFIADATIEALSTPKGEQPFLVWSSIIDPHHPFNPPAPHCDVFDDVDFPPPPDNNGPNANLPEIYHHWAHQLRDVWGYKDFNDFNRTRRMYQGKVHHVDYQVGRILHALRENNLEENTIVLFFSDHGMMLGDFGLMQVGEYSQNPMVQIPLIWRVPGMAAQASDGLASMVDILPTLLDLCDMEIPLGMQGKSLKPVLAGKQKSVREQLIIENRWGQNPPEGFNTLVTLTHKLSVYSNGREGELYDLENDPREEANLFGKPQAQEIQRELTARFAAEMLRHQDPLPRRTARW